MLLSESYTWSACQLQYVPQTLPAVALQKFPASYLHAKRVNLSLGHRTAALNTSGMLCLHRTQNLQEMTRVSSSRVRHGRVVCEIQSMVAKHQHQSLGIQRCPSHGGGPAVATMHAPHELRLAIA